MRQTAKKSINTNPNITTKATTPTKPRRKKIKRIETKHDALFRKAFSDRDNIKGFIKEYLDPKLLKHLDLATLELMPDTFVDADLSLTAADLVWKLKFKDKDYFLIFLFEHKSYVDQYTIRQILKYKLQIWDKLDEIADEKKNLAKNCRLSFRLCCIMEKPIGTLKNFKHTLRKHPKFFMNLYPNFE